MLVLALTLAVAAPPGYRETRSDVAGGCDLFLGQADSEGVVPMRAECDWPDVTVAQFEAAYGDWASHDEIYGNISSSVVLSSEGTTHSVRQTFEAGGIKTREMIIVGSREDVPGGVKYSWHKQAGDQGITTNNVEVTRSTGYWLVTERAEGGVHAEYELSYDPGGSVPGFLVRWFQGSGLQGIIEDTRNAVVAAGG